VAKPWRVFLLLSFVPNNLKQTKKTFWQWRWFLGIETLEKTITDL
jgi:hypothetical protein